MRRALILALLLVGMRLILPLGRDVPGSGALLTLGFLILAAYTVGEIAGNLGLPKLLGYLVAGIIFGPSGLGTVTSGSVFKLQPISQLAVALIAFVAGAELKWDDVKRDGPRYLRILGTEMPLTFALCIGAVFALRAMIPVLNGSSITEVTVFAMLLAAIAIAHSPAATLGLIKETEARGPVTHHTLGVVLLSDLFLILFFTTWGAHAITEWQVFTDEQRSHGEAPEVGDFLSQFGQGTLENWQSEFLQLFTMAVLTAFLIHKGSTESRDSDEEMGLQLAAIRSELAELRKEKKA